jgi:hypothetical protein
MQEGGKKLHMANRGNSLVIKLQSFNKNELPFLLNFYIFAKFFEKSIGSVPDKKLL